MNNIILKGRGIIKSFGNISVLKEVDIEVKEAEIVAIMGKSGSGKSTLLQILGTLDSADGGTLEIDGKVINEMRQKEIAQFRNKKLGFIFQFHHLLNEFTALENVLIPAYIGGQKSAIVEKKAEDLLDYLGLKDRMTHKPGQLSGGEQQRVAVARALINDPIIVFADEPSGNLDQESSNELHDLFLKLRKDFSQSFVLVTHSMELGKLSDRTLMMHDGNLA